MQHYYGLWRINHPTHLKAVAAWSRNRARRGMGPSTSAVLSLCSELLLGLCKQCVLSSPTGQDEVWPELLLLHDSGAPGGVCLFCFAFSSLPLPTELTSLGKEEMNDSGSAHPLGTNASRKEGHWPDPCWELTCNTAKRGCKCTAITPLHLPLHQGWFLKRKSKSILEDDYGQVCTVCFHASLLDQKKKKKINQNICLARITAGFWTLETPYEPVVKYHKNPTYCKCWLSPYTKLTVLKSMATLNHKIPLK